MRYLREPLPRRGFSRSPRALAPAPPPALMGASRRRGGLIGRARLLRCSRVWASTGCALRFPCPFSSG